MYIFVIFVFNILDDYIILRYPYYKAIQYEVETCDITSLRIFDVSVECLFYPCKLQVLYYSVLHENKAFFILRN